MNEKADLGYIDLTDVVALLNRQTFDKYQLQIIEEVVFLCVNESFIQDIENIRKWMLGKYPKMPIPTKNLWRAEGILGFIYRKHYKKYKNLIAELIEKYKLISNLYWQDKFAHLDMKIKDEMEDEKISQKEARSRAIEEISDNIDLELLDSIIIRNKPFDTSDGFPFWCNPYFTRKLLNGIKPITMNIKKDWITQMEIGFPAYATLPEMQKLLKDNYKEIQIYRQKHLPLKAIKDSRKSSLAKMIDAYLFYLEGKNNARIAVELDKKYGGDLTLDAVNVLIKRLKQESFRFNKQTDKKS